MKESSMLELETQIQSLLCGDLSPRQRQALLARIATDEAARRLLAEMIRCRDMSRRAFGHDRAEEAMEASLKAVQDRLSSSDRRGAAGVGKAPGVLTVRPRWRSFVWPAAAAAAILVAVYLGLQGWSERQRIRQQIAEVNSQVLALEVTAEQLGNYRRIWNEIAVPAGEASPWILFRNGGARFEHLTVTAADLAAKPVLVRCLVVSADGTAAECISILLPPRRPLRASLGEAGRIAGRPVLCDVARADGWVTLDIRVSGDKGRTVGVRGSVQAGQKASEVGTFRLGDREMRVFLRAVELDTGVS